MIDGTEEFADTGNSIAEDLFAKPTQKKTSTLGNLFGDTNKVFDNMFEKVQETGQAVVDVLKESTDSIGATLNEHTVNMLDGGVLDGTSPKVGGMGTIDPGTETMKKMPRKHACKCMATKRNAVDINFKKLHEDAVLPAYAKPGDAGMDCYAVEEPDLTTGKYVGYKLGFAMEIPEGYVGLMFPRSSISKKDLMLANCVGVIDSGYRGEVEARFNYIVNTIDITRNTDKSYDAKSNDERYSCMYSHEVYKKGDAVCQLIVLPYPQVTSTWVDELSTTERGEGGFGHTGNQ